MPLGTVWSPEEDERLAELVRIHGPKKWSQIANDLGTNKGSKQCRRRWKNFLSLDDRKLGSWTPQEDAQLIECHRKHGNKWTLIAAEIGGRTDNAVKNRWAALEKKKRMGEEGSFVSQLRSSGSRSDLLGVRRIITKDQPQRYARQPPAVADAGWLQDHLGAAAAVVQQDQGPYLMQAAGAPYSRQPGTGTSGMPIRKPDLMINIPGATAPELPYSQRSQGDVDANRLQKSGALTPVEVWLGPAGTPVDMAAQARPEDDGLLSTSRQGAHNAIAALATPTEEPNTISELYKFLYGATPSAQQLAAAAGVGAAAVAAAAASNVQPAQSAPWAGQLQPAPQQLQLVQQQMPPGSSAPHMLYTQQQQQQQHMLQPQGAVCSAPHAGAMSFMQSQPGRLPPLQQQGSLGPFSQPLPQPPLPQQQQQQAIYGPSKLSRTVSGLDCSLQQQQLPSLGPPQPSLPEAMMFKPEAMMFNRHHLTAPQPRFVPQGPQTVTTLIPDVLGANNAAGPPAAAATYQQCSQPMALQDPQQQPQMLVAMQPPPLMPQQQPQPPLLVQPQAQSVLLAQQPPQVMAHGPAPPPPPQQQQWGAEELRQLLDILGEAVGNEPPQLMAPPPPQLCHMDHPTSEEEVEQANNVTGRLAAAT